MTGRNGNNNERQVCLQACENKVLDAFGYGNCQWNYYQRNGCQWNNYQWNYCRWSSWHW